MPDKLINLDNLGRFKDNLDVVLEDKADVDEVYLKTEADTLLGGKQDNLSAAQLENINDVPNKQDAMGTISNDLVDALFGYLQVDPILANNSWEVIAAACEAGIASNYWSLGDTKTDVGTDSTTRTFRICDMQGLYGKHVVFEQVELENISLQWNQSSNKDSDNCYNDYAISDMRTTHLPAILAKYSSDLKSFITNTTYKVATNGNNGTLLDLTDKLFLPAEREIFASRVDSRTEEWDALTRYALYAANDTAEFRKKYKFGATNASGWWLRSPYRGYAMSACYVVYYGDAGATDASNTAGVAPFFSL